MNEGSLLCAAKTSQGRVVQCYSTVDLLLRRRSNKSLSPALTSILAEVGATFASPIKQSEPLCASLARQPGGMPGTPFRAPPKPGGMPGTPHGLCVSAPLPSSLPSGGGTLADLRPMRPMSPRAWDLAREPVSRCFRASAKSCSTCASDRRCWLHVRAALNHSASLCSLPWRSSSESRRARGGRGGRAGSLASLELARGAASTAPAIDRAPAEGARVPAVDALVGREDARDEASEAELALRALSVRDSSERTENHLLKGTLWTTAKAGSLCSHCSTSRTGAVELRL